MTDFNPVKSSVSEHLSTIDTARALKVNRYFSGALKTINEQTSEQALVEHDNTPANQKRHNKIQGRRIIQDALGCGDDSIRHQESEEFKAIILDSVMRKSLQNLLALLENEAFVAYMNESGVVVPEVSEASPTLTLTMLSKLIPEIIEKVNDKLQQDQKRGEALDANGIFIAWLGYAALVVTSLVATVATGPAVLIGSVVISVAALMVMLTGIYQDHVGGRLLERHKAMRDALSPMKYWEDSKASTVSAYLGYDIHKLLEGGISQDKWTQKEFKQGYHHYNLFTPSYGQYGLDKQCPAACRDEYLKQNSCN